MRGDGPAAWRKPPGAKAPPPRAAVWHAMSADPFATRWPALVGPVRARWAELTDDEIAAIAGRRERLEAALQIRYGRSPEQAAAEVDYWLSRLGAGRAEAPGPILSERTA
jgi:uncharacterized protein YjbJ (UPF0337 family)